MTTVELQTCNCGAVTLRIDEDALQLVTGVNLKVRTHYFGKVDMTPCTQPRTFTPGKQ